MEQFVSKEIRNVQETGFYDLNPDLVFVETQNLSYRMNGENHPRTLDVFKDKDGHTWFQLTKQPKKQLAIALLSHGIFNTSPIGRIIHTENKIIDYFSGFNPKILALIKPLAKVFDQSKEVFVSKGVLLDRMQSMSKEEVYADYILFCSLFSEYDRNINQGHNIRLSKDSYALYDFDANYFVPKTHFKPEVVKKKFVNCIDQIKYRLASTKDQMEYSWEHNPLPVNVLKNLLLKQSDLNKYFSGNEGKRFFMSVIQKSGYIEEYKDEFKRAAQNDAYASRTEDPSYTDPQDLYNGFMQTIQALRELSIEEYRKYESDYVSQGFTLD